MAGIRSGDTKPERVVRKFLHAAGLRYRLHVPDLPGKPDLVFPRHNVALFVHGCFWHGHTCRYFKVPSTRTDFWVTKIRANQARDARQIERLREMGWRVLVIWECATRELKGHDLERLLLKVRAWILTGRPSLIRNDPYLFSPSASGQLERGAD